MLNSEYLHKESFRAWADTVLVLWTWTKQLRLHNFEILILNQFSAVFTSPVIFQYLERAQHGINLTISDIFVVISNIPVHTPVLWLLSFLLFIFFFEKKILARKFKRFVFSPELCVRKINVYGKYAAIGDCVEVVLKIVKVLGIEQLNAFTTHNGIVSCRVVSHILCTHAFVSSLVQVDNWRIWTVMFKPVQNVLCAQSVQWVPNTKVPKCTWIKAKHIAFIYIWVFECTLTAGKRKTCSSNSNSSTIEMHALGILLCNFMTNEEVGICLVVSNVISCSFTRKP